MKALLWVLLWLICCWGDESNSSEKLHICVTARAAEPGIFSVTKQTNKQQKKQPKKEEEEEEKSISRGKHP